MIRLLLAALLLAAPPALSEALTDSAAPTGLWLTGKQGVVVDLYECGGALCGRTVWLKRMTSRDGSPRLDRRNPDPALRNRHWCGIEVITGLQPKGEGRWTGGKVYDPKTGRSFDFDLARAGEGLEARGYVGVPFVGRSELWTRADPAAFKACTDG